MNWRDVFRLLHVIWGRTALVWRGPRAVLVVGAFAFSCAPPSAMVGAIIAMSFGAVLYAMEESSDSFWSRFIGPGHLLVHGLMWGSVAMLVRQSAASLRGSDGYWAYAATIMPSIFTEFATVMADLTALIAMTGILIAYIVFHFSLLVRGVTALREDRKTEQRL